MIRYRASIVVILLLFAAVATSCNISKTPMQTASPPESTPVLIRQASIPVVPASTLPASSNIPSTVTKSIPPALPGKGTIKGQFEFDRFTWGPNNLTMLGFAEFPDGTNLETALYKSNSLVGWWPTAQAIQVRDGQWQISVNPKQFGGPDVFQIDYDYSFKIWAKDNPDANATFTLTYVDNGPTGFAPPPATPTPVDSIPPEDWAITYSFINEKDLLGSGIQLPAALSSQESSRVTEIGLSISPVSDKIALGNAYRADLLWMSYDAKSGWGYYNSIDKITQVKDGTVYFPAVMIGLGNPQQEEIDVAVDLGAQRAVYAIRRPDKRVIPPAYVKTLTEIEKEKIIALASAAPSVKGLLTEGYDLSYQLVAISKSEGYIFSLNYDIVEKGIPAYQNSDIESKSMRIYPAVVFTTQSWAYSVAVDLGTEKIMYTYKHPVRQE